MPSNDAQKPLQTLSSALNNLIREAIREDFAWECWDVDSRRFMLEDVAEGFEIGVSPADERMAELEGGDVGLAYDLVVCVHLPSETMCLRISDLNLKEALWNTVHFLDRLLPS